MILHAKETENVKRYWDLNEIRTKAYCLNHERAPHE